MSEELEKAIGYVEIVDETLKNAVAGMDSIPGGKLTDISLDDWRDIIINAPLDDEVMQELKTNSLSLFMNIFIMIVPLITGKSGSSLRDLSSAITDALARQRKTLALYKKMGEEKEKFQEFLLKNVKTGGNA